MLAGMFAVIWKTAAALVAMAALYVAFVALMQDRILFPRWAVSGQAPPLPADAEELTLELPGGDTLAGVRLPARRPGGDSQAVLLGFGGNAWHADSLAAHLCELFPTRDVVAFHYRGYGPSTGRPSARALNEDALAIFDALKRRDPDRPIIVVGLSIGGGPASYLAARRDVAGVILVTPFDSMEAQARDRFPFIPVRLLLRHRMDVADDMRDYDGPAAIVAAELDTIVPPERTEALRQAVRRPVFDAVIDGAGHNDLYARRAYAEAMQTALAQVEDEIDTDTAVSKRPRPETGGAAGDCAGPG